MILNTNTPLPEDTTDCGTPKGYRRHLRRGAKPCAECKAAWRRYVRSYRKSKGRK